MAAFQLADWSIPCVINLHDVPAFFALRIALGIRNLPWQRISRYFFFLFANSVFSLRPFFFLRHTARLPEQNSTTSDLGFSNLDRFLRYICVPDFSKMSRVRQSFPSLFNRKISVTMTLNFKGFRVEEFDSFTTGSINSAMATRFLSQTRCAKAGIT